MSIFIYHEDYTGPRWTYGLTLRPAARFNIPDGFIIGSQQAHPDFKSFGTIDYPMELTSEELKHYDMIFISKKESTDES